MAKCITLLSICIVTLNHEFLMVKNTQSFFPCNVGASQGENLSPALFSLYVNDLVNFMSANDILNVFQMK